MLTTITLILSYLIGSVSPGFIICKILYNSDPRSIGTASTGATNAARVGGLKFFLIVLSLDMLKGAVAIILLQNFGAENLSPFALLGVVIGHIFPIGLGFRGGRGVAPYLGAHFVLQSNLIFPALILALAVKSLKVRKEFKAMALFVFPIFLLLSHSDTYLVLASLVASVIVFCAHLPFFERSITLQTKVS